MLHSMVADKNMKNKFSFISIVLLALFVSLPVAAETIGVDLELSASDVVLSDSSPKLVPGQIVRLYANVINLGVSDAIGQVVFYLNAAKQIGSAEVSLKSSGVKDEVFIDFLVPNDDFNVLVKVVSVSPNDQNLSNNEVTTQTFKVKKDTDRDGIYDDEDSDDDNDGVSDADELKKGTDPLNKDTDGDGAIDSVDAYPLDPSKTKIEEPKPVQKPKNETAKIEQLPAPTTQKKKTIISTSKTESKTVVKGSSPEKKSPDEKSAELVDDFYNSPEVELLNRVEVVAQQLNWNTFDFNFKTNIDGLDVKKLNYEWNFGDGFIAQRNGSHRYARNGEYLATLKVKGPWDNNLYDSARVRVAFWSVYNYWLWLIVLAVALLIFIYGYGFKHKTVEEPKSEREIKQPKKRRVKAD